LTKTIGTWQASTKRARVERRERADRLAPRLEAQSRRRNGTCALAVDDVWQDKVDRPSEASRARDPPSEPQRQVAREREPARGTAHLEGAAARDDRHDARHAAARGEREVSAERIPGDDRRPSFARDRLREHLERTVDRERLAGARAMARQVGDEQLDAGRKSPRDPERRLAIRGRSM